MEEVILCMFETETVRESITEEKNQKEPKSNTGLSFISWCLFLFKLYIFFISPCSACLFNIYVRLNTNNNTARS